MSVSEGITLPDQPSSGLARWTPLGGDGFTAPFAQFTVEAWQQTGNATGGTMLFTLNTDPRFCALVGHATFQIQQGTPADAVFRSILRTDAAAGGTILAARNETLEHTGSTFTNTVATVVVPPGFVLPGGAQAGGIQLQAANVEDDVYTVAANVYLFNIRVREVYPIGPLLWARGTFS